LRYYIKRVISYFVKVVEAGPILSATEIYLKESNFWQYLIYGDIRKITENECTERGDPHQKQ